MAKKDRKKRQAEASTTPPLASESPEDEAQEYEREMRALHGELVAMQEWVKASGAKICIVFEGRDTAGKGGTIKADHRAGEPARVPDRRAARSHRAREVADVHPAVHRRNSRPPGEVVIFDRSWYNRAGVERVMGFCTPEESRAVPELVPAVEKVMADSGILLLKYWLEVGPDEQTRRLQSRITTRGRSGSCRTWT